MKGQVVANFLWEGSLDHIALEGNKARAQASADEFKRRMKAAFPEVHVVARIASYAPVKFECSGEIARHEDRVMEIFDAV